jgi:HNH endonuclease/NUMOD4 motif
MAAPDLTIVSSSELQEEWRPIPTSLTAPGLYEASSYGRIRRLEGHDRRQRHLPRKILSPLRNTWGGLYLRLQGQCYLVHDLVTLAFFGTRPDGHEVQHLDKDKRNNRLENLTYTPHPALLPLQSGTVEEWRPVAHKYDPAGHYEVSNLGRIRRGTWVDACGRQVHARLLRPHKAVHDYRSVQFGKKRYLIHQIVAQSFLGPCPVGYEPNHCDGNKHNNHVTNLEYVSHAANMRHAAVTGLTVRGTQKPDAKLQEADVYAIRAAQGSVNYLLLAARYGVSPTTIYAIWNRLKWAWLDEQPTNDHCSR